MENPHQVSNHTNSNNQVSSDQSRGRSGLPSRKELGGQGAPQLNI